MSITLPLPPNLQAPNFNQQPDWTPLDKNKKRQDDILIDNEDRFFKFRTNLGYCNTSPSSSAQAQCYTNYPGSYRTDPVIEKEVGGTLNPYFEASLL